MTSRIVVAAILGTALALPACGNTLGPTTPVCDQAASAVILSAQALPGTAFVPCINSLKTDWEYDDLRAERGRATFGLGSLGMGMSFLRVTLQPTCDTSAARRVTSDEPGVPLYVDVDDDDEVRVTVITDDQGAVITQYASDLVSELDGSVLADRTVVVQLDTRATPVTQRLQEAHEAGAVVLIVTVRDSEQRTVSVLLPGEGSEETRVAVADLNEALRDITQPATYKGSWYYPFANGCVVYTFDAQGSGVSTIESDVKAALGLFDAEAMRQQARDAGFDVR
jgi:hypothetical protein